MTEQKTISVIVPSYCHEDYILECIGSIYDQTYKNIELVVVDDKSNDGTFDMLSKLLSTGFSKRFSRTVLLKNNENLGAHATINRGISASSGEYIAIINSDDSYKSTRLECMVATLINNKSEIGFSLVEAFIENPSTDPLSFIPHEFLLFGMRQKLDIVRDATTSFSLLRKNVAVSTGNMMFSRDIFNKIGPFIQLKYCHDWDFILQASFFTEPVVHLEPLYRYRLHNSNSFSSLQGLASVESEVVYRRFFRRGLMGRSPNAFFPSEENWPGYFQVFLQEIEKMHFYELELKNYHKNWRIYEN